MSIFPNKLKKDDTIALVSPAGAVYEPEALEIAVESLQALGLKVKKGRHLANTYGYLAGTDAERTEDLHAAFADKNVQAIIAMRGGYGCGRLLEHVDYQLISQNPKIFAGFSDITALLLAIHKKTRLVTFHSPMGSSVWNEFTTAHFRQVLFEDMPQRILQNPSHKGDHLTQTQDRIHTLQAGEVEGCLLGGNLTVLASLIGTPYLPDFENSILFLEEVNEDIYRIDRLLCQLKLSGILARVKGVVLGKFTNCGHGNRFASLTLDEVFSHYFQDLNIPCFRGAMIGHIDHKFTLPIGAHVRINARLGSIEIRQTGTKSVA